MLLQEAYDLLLATENRLDGLRVGLDLALAKSRAGLRSASFGLLKDLLEQAASANLVTFVLERKDEVGRLLSSARELDELGGDRVLRGFITNLLARHHAAGEGAPTSGRAAQRLTDRERSILGFIAAGHSNKEIARELGVAPETIKTHVKRIFQKLSAETPRKPLFAPRAWGCSAIPAVRSNRILAKRRSRRRRPSDSARGDVGSSGRNRAMRRKFRRPRSPLIGE